VSPESVSWRVFKNPLSLFIGGVAAVIMELDRAARAHRCVGAHSFSLRTANIGNGLNGFTISVSSLKCLTNGNRFLEKH